jgi:hypothetical protein
VQKKTLTLDKKYLNFIDAENWSPPEKRSTNWESIIPVFFEDAKMTGKQEKTEDIVLKLRTAVQKSATVAAG